MKKYQDKKWLSEQMKKYHSGNAISRNTGIPETTIHRWLNKFNLNNEPIRRNLTKSFLITQYQAGKQIRQIAKEIKCSTSTIVEANQKFNLSVTDYNPKYNYKDEKWLIEQFDKYGYVTEVAKQTGSPRTCITRYAEKYGIKEKSYNRHENYKVNEDYFKKINTEHKAYWLGFIMADGNIYINKNLHKQFSIRLKATDGMHLNKIAKDIEYNGPISYGTSKRKNTVIYYAEIRIYNNNFCNNLILHGIVPRKSGKEILPQEIPNNLIPSFIRGFVDGDGSVLLNPNYFGVYSTSKKIIENIQVYFKYTLNTCLNISQQKNMYSIRTTAKKNLYKILNLLYDKSTISLDRKYNNYLKIMSAINCVN